MSFTLKYGNNRLRSSPAVGGEGQVAPFRNFIAHDLQFARHLIKGIGASDETERRIDSQ
jgi:hypothetical protein